MILSACCNINTDFNDWPQTFGVRNKSGTATVSSSHTDGSGSGLSSSALF